eukprot:TRINITY_DN1197_c0_g1_i1.p1 TRINITY_DN1197_c0_g1~~TRINITY_DN1197_c0_g1_i1.p1  ORF type:complete len:340 (-),score=62.32 TRINITY_DN1197_c0_g1_i1:1897-2916(-)
MFQFGQAPADLTVHSATKRIDRANVLKFRLRLDSVLPQDVGRRFSGGYFPLHRTLYVTEIRTVGGRVTLLPIFAEDCYISPSGESFVLEDFFVGNKLVLGPTLSQRDCGAVKVFIVTDLDEEQLTAANDPVAKMGVTQRATQKSNALAAIREDILHRYGPKALIKEIAKYFCVVDASGDRKLEASEVTKLLIQRLQLAPADASAIMSTLDKDMDGSISFDEFLLAVRGDMSEIRKQCVREAFCKMDYNKNGVLTVEDIRAFYCAKYHPKVLSGEMTEEAALQKFLNTFDFDHNGVITAKEFEDYYNAVSASIDDDDYFVFMMQRAWNLDHRNATRITFH